MAKSKFKIAPFTNPSDNIAYRLSGTLNGKRIRENYKTRPEAVAQHQTYDVEHLNGEQVGRTVWTTLTPEQNRDAVTAIHSLKSHESEYSLSFAVNYFLNTFRPPENEKSTETAANEYIEKRVVFLQPNAKFWLEKYPLDCFPVVPPRNADRMLRELRKKFNIGHDVLCHTYISMTVGAFRSVGDAALQAGNSESVIRKHYLDLKSVEEADSFWSITSRGTGIPKIEKKDGKYIPAKLK